jgi:large subunit ribosomal protein L15
MSNTLSRLSPPAGARHSERRVGRGPGGRKGKTCGRGMKGQKARHGGDFGKLHFQGGQTPIQRRLPKRGFRVPFPVPHVAVNLSDLERFKAGASVDEAALLEAGLIPTKGLRIKVLGEGELTKKLKVSAHQFSQTARDKIKKAGGDIVELPFRAAAQKPAQAN